MNHNQPLDSHSGGPNTTQSSPSAQRSRRGSRDSTISRQQADRGALAQTLDHIHTTASRSESLTTFNDFTPPPPSSSGNDERGLAENVQGGLGALYTRLKASVAGGKEAPTGLFTSSGQSKRNSTANSVKNYRPGTPSGLSKDLLDASPAGASHLSPSLASTTHSPRETRADKLLQDPDVAGSGSKLVISSFEDNVARFESPRTSFSTMNAPVREETAEPLNASFDAGGCDPVNQHEGSTDPNIPIGEILDTSLEGKSSTRVQPMYTNSGGASQAQKSRQVEDGSGDDVLRPLLIPSDHTSSQISSATTSERLGNATSRPNPSKHKATQSRSFPDRGATTHANTAHPRGFMSQMRRSVLGRELWMRDENAKVCFNCGDRFSTFRRKHHCRTCGQIYDSRCTVLIPGKTFNQAGKIRVCKTCESIINGDDSSDYSDADDTPSTPQVRQIRFSSIPEGIDAPSKAGSSDDDDEGEKVSTPDTNSSFIPRTRDGRRKSVTFVAPDIQSQSALARPGSSRSLKSLNSRPRSGSQKHRRSRSQHMRSLGLVVEDSAPFQSGIASEQSRGVTVPAFQAQWGANSVIDPDLAPFASDEGSSEDEPASIAATMQNELPVNVEAGYTGLFGAFKKSRLNPLAGNNTDLYQASREADNNSVASSKPRLRRRQMGTRALSTGSIGRYGPLIRPGRSENIHAITNSLEAVIHHEKSVEHAATDVPIRPTTGMHRGVTYDHAATSVKFSDASLRHLERLLRQFLKDASIEKPKHWEKALTPILLSCAQNVEPNIHRGDDIDIRHYIKLKRAPGGVPFDSHYVSGVVFSKNVALKDMPRHIKNARILVLSFPLEYARRQVHFMSLEPIIAQEREYLRNLVNRILLLEPHVLLVQHNVSGLALKFLQDARVAVVQNVKYSTLQAISRCTQTRTVSSVEKLNMSPSQLGLCQSFDIKTILYRGIKKSYIYVSGCQSDLGCTIVLRGAGLKTLSKLKWIAEFMCYVAYNLKLETCLMRDQFVESSDMHGPKEAQLTEQNGQSIHEGSTPEAMSGTTVQTRTSVPSEDLEEPREEQRQGDALSKIEPKSTNVSGDAPLKKTGLNHKDKYDRIVRELQGRYLSVSPFVVLATPYLLERVCEQEQQLNRLQELIEHDQVSACNEKGNQLNHHFQLVRPEMVYDDVANTNVQVREVIRAVHDAEYEKSLHNYTTLKRRWETSVATAVEPFSPLSHQRLVVLFSIVSTITSDACVGPDLLGLDFYQEREVDQSLEPDVPLGEYVERLCGQVDEPCTNQNCEKKMIDHHRQYVHGHGQVSVYVTRLPSKLRGMENTILMWSCCRVCNEETQVALMSGSTWKYSFGKYLELCFWSTTLHTKAGTCTHDVHRNHIRMFGFRDAAISVQYDPVTIVEVVVPRTTITWKVERDLNIKNDQYQRIEERLSAFMTSVKQRIKSINLESMNPDKVEACRDEVVRLNKKANDEYHFLIQKLREKYLSSKYHEIMPLNQAVRALQEKVAEWDQAFQDFEKNFYPSERDLRKLAALQLRKVYLGLDDANAGNTATERETKTSQIEMTEIPRDDEKRHPADDQLPDTPLEGFPSSPLPFPEKGFGLRESPLTKRASVSDRSHVQARPEAEQKMVDQLDLAVPIIISEPQLAAANIEEKVVDDGTVAHHGEMTFINSSPSIMPLHPDVAEKVEQMIKPPMDSGVDDADVTSQIEQVATENPVHSNLVVAPPLFRAQSSPNPGETSTSLPLVKKPLDSSEAGVPTESMVFAPSRIPTPGMAFLRSSVQKPETATEGRIAERIGLAAFRTGKMTMQSMIPRAVPRGRNDSKVSALAKHFEEMSREFEKERIRERHQRAVRNQQVRAFPMSSSRPIVEIFRDAHEAVREHDTVNEDARDSFRDDKSVGTFDGKPIDLEESARPEGDEVSPERTSHEHLESSPRSIKQEDSVAGTGPSASSPSLDIDTILSETELPPLSETQGSFTLPEGNELLEAEEASLEVEIPKHEKTSLLKLLTSFWSERSASGWTQLDYPIDPTDHVFVDSDVIVREDEPSSLIAFALASQDYNNKLRKSRDKLKADEPPVVDGASEGHLDDFTLERMLLGKTATHMKYQIQDGSAKMHCKVFYAESFDAIRRKCGVADRFVESLSRCFKWDSKGGKTKSLFLKTLDERFVIKSLSQIETQAFLKFAPDYFDYMSKCFFHGLPSALAKMVGFFQVMIKNPITGVEITHFLQVMENVFYEGPSDRMFDLKGSMRNRRVPSTGEQNEVLLDENFLDYISQTPIYVRNHSENLLSWTIRNDTLFCSKQNVMDYSLIVGLYSDKKEVLVGIIDYIRTYTWDKKLESWIKDRGKHKPTVMSPKDYRRRFRTSIPNYFPAVPSCWQFATPQRAASPSPVEGPAGVNEEEEGEEEEEEEEEVESGLDGVATEDGKGGGT